MARWPLRALVTVTLALLAACTAPASPAYPTGSVASPTAPREAAAPRATTPDSVTSYLTALRNGDHASALASADDSGDSPAGADTAENIYLFLGSGPIRVMDWRLAGATPAGDGGQWVFVVCQLTLADGSGREMPLTFHTNRAGKLVFVG